MKKKILSGIFALALLITAGYGVNKSVNGNADLSVLALSNVEALVCSDTITKLILHDSKRTSNF